MLQGMTYTEHTFGARAFVISFQQYLFPAFQIIRLGKIIRYDMQGPSLWPIPGWQDPCSIIASKTTELPLNVFLMQLLRRYLTCPKINFWRKSRTRRSVSCPASDHKLCPTHYGLLQSLDSCLLLNCFRLWQIKCIKIYQSLCHRSEFVAECRTYRILCWNRLGISEMTKW